MKKSEIFQELPKYDTQRHEVSECCWESGTDSLVTGLPQTFSLQNMQYLRSEVFV